VSLPGLLPLLTVPSGESLRVGQSQQYREKYALLLTGLDLAYLSASHSSDGAEGRALLLRHVGK
jgi:hypothetical protein